MATNFSFTMDRYELRKLVYKYLSERIMIVLAIIAIPMVFVEIFTQQGSLFFNVAFAIDWFIWLAFLLEFALKLYIADNKLLYIRTNKLNTLISLVIIMSPLIGLWLTSKEAEAFPIFRALRISRLFFVAAPRFASGMAYVGKIAATQKQEESKRPMQDTFIVSRIELRQMMILLGVGERDISSLLSYLDKAHRHTNIIIFVNYLERLGVNRESIANIFRRMGVDDVTISNAFRMVDESRISAETGRLYDVNVDLTS